MSTITNDGSDIINKTIQVKYSVSNNDETINRFEIDETCKWIKDNNFKKVGLQFPDELMSIAVPIVLKLRLLVECEFGIMSDTSFGGCCVDEVGGEHYNVEAIVHYGNSCLTSTHRKLPVKWVFGQMSYDDEYINMCASDIYNNIMRDVEDNTTVTCVTLLSDHRYSDFSNLLANKLSTKSNICVHQTLPNLEHHKESLIKDIDYEVIGSRIFLLKKHCDEKSLKKEIIVFVCEELDHAVKSTLLSLFHLHQPMTVFSPSTRSINDVTEDIERFLCTRLYRIEVARTAQRVGLLVGTLSIERYLDMYEYLSLVIREAGKTVYPMIVGKINPVKLTNFADLDVIVVINCMESCLQFSDKSAGFFKPVVTPYEMVCACDSTSRRFTNPRVEPYITDFRELLKEENKISGHSDGDDCRLPTMSMISGRLLAASDHLQQDTEYSVGALLPRLDSDWSVSAIDRSKRSWFGLDPNLGQDPVSLVTEGLNGIASGYNHEL